MHIGIDARFLGSASKGLGRYTEELVRNLERIEDDATYTVFLRKDNWDVWTPKDSRFTKRLADYRWYSLEEQFYFPKELKKAQCDLYHFPHFNVPLFAPKPYVVTIHDLILSHFPTVKATTLGPLKYWFKHRMYLYVMRKALTNASHIIAVSEYTKKDLMATYSLADSRLSVTYEGVSDFVSARKKSPSSLSDFKIKKPYLLYVGNAYPHKNLERLLDAFQQIVTRNPGIHLVMVGKHDFFYQRLIQFAVSKKIPNVVFPGYVPDADLSAVYENALLYVFPSLYEGFGLPPLEAMQHQVPVVSSNSSCLPEIMGNAAVYFSPENTHDIVKTVSQVISDDALRKKLQILGKEQVKKYSWLDTAKKTSEIYKSIHA